MTTAERIKRAREAAGISQARLAALVGVAPSTPYRWEAGRSLPQNGEMERRIARALGVAAEELFAYDDELASGEAAGTENGAAVA